jgi:hypothetical protein
MSAGLPPTSRRIPLRDQVFSELLLKACHEKELSWCPPSAGPMILFPYMRLLSLLSGCGTRPALELDTGFHRYDGGGVFIRGAFAIAGGYALPVSASVSLKTL